MSSSTGIALITANFVPLIFVYFWLTKRADDLALGIVLGNLHGVPIAAEHRNLLLYHSWVALAMGGISAGVIGVLLNLSIAGSVISEEVSILAYVAAFIAACGVLGFALTAVFELRYYKSVLRQDAD